MTDTNAHIGKTSQKRIKPTLCMDFDGVIHSYTSGWKGVEVIPDPPVPGALRWLWAATEWFKVVIYSARSCEIEGRNAMQAWLMQESAKEFGPGHPMSEDAEPGYYPIDFVAEKPKAFLTIDDRAVQFYGPEFYQEIPSVDLLDFKPWYDPSFKETALLPILTPLPEFTINNLPKGVSEKLLKSSGVVSVDPAPKEKALAEALRKIQERCAKGPNSDALQDVWRIANFAMIEHEGYVIKPSVEIPPDDSEPLLNPVGEWEIPHGMSRPPVEYMTRGTMPKDDDPSLLIPVPLPDLYATTLPQGMFDAVSGVFRNEFPGMLNLLGSRGLHRVIEGIVRELMLAGFNRAFDPVPPFRMALSAHHSPYDCLHKLRPDEPYFVLRGQDGLAPELIERWAGWAKMHGCAHEKTGEALRIADFCRRYCPTKYPD